MRLPKPLQWLCGVIGHVPGTDWGSGGGDFVDCWCARCDKMFMISTAEAWKRYPQFAHLKKIVAESGMHKGLPMPGPEVQPSQKRT